MNRVPLKVNRSLLVESFSNKDYQAGYLQARYTPANSYPNPMSRLQATEADTQFKAGFAMGKLEMAMLEDYEHMVNQLADLQSNKLTEKDSVS